MSLVLHIIVTYIKENMITKLQKLYSPPRNPRAGNKSPMLFVKNPLCTVDLSPLCKIFIEKPVENYYLLRKLSCHTMQNIISSLYKEIRWNCLISESCERRKNIQKKYSVDTLTGTATADFGCVSLSSLSKKHNVIKVVY